MFMDVVVFAGIGTVALMVAFFFGLYYFVKKEEQNRKSNWSFLTPQARKAIWATYVALFFASISVLLGVVENSNKCSGNRLVWYMAIDQRT